MTSLLKSEDWIVDSDERERERERIVSIRVRKQQRSEMLVGIHKTKHYHRKLIVLRSFDDV